MKKREGKADQPSRRAVRFPRTVEAPVGLKDIPELLTGHGLVDNEALGDRLADLTPPRGVNAVLALQRVVGNRSVRRALEALGREGGPVGAAVEQSIETTRADGRPLDRQARSRMEQTFGHDFSGVRVHTGGEADRLSRELDAKAFTTGSDIYFRSGEYRPESAAGRELLAHELAHVVQQEPAIGGRLTVGAPDDAYEREADDVARQVARHDQRGEMRGVHRPAVPRLSRIARRVQRKLKFTGTSAHLARVLTILNGGLFGYTVSVDASGNLSIAANQDVGPPSPAQSALYGRLNTIVGDSHQVTVAVESGGTALGGSYATGTIDVADLEAFGGGEGLSAVGALIHEIEEQYRKQVSSQGYATAHAGALVAETEQSGATRGTERTLSSSANADGTINAVVEVPYTYPDGRVVTLTLTISHNNITNVTRR